MASNHSRERAARQLHDEVRALQRRFVIVTVLLVVLFLGFIFDIIFFQLPHEGSQSTPLLGSFANPCKQSSFDNGNGIKVEPLPDKSEYVGISGGQFPFDQMRPDYALKCQGAQAFMKNQPQAMGYWQQASAKESNDAEALIYQEDLRVKNSGKKYISFIIGTILTGDYVNIGRDVLQGAYVAQYLHNHSDKPPQINLLIANFGSIVRENFQAGPGEEEQIANQIKTAVQDDSHIKGIMIGLPFIASYRTITTLDTAGIPVVLSGGFDEAQIAGTTNIFPVGASTDREGEVGAKYVKQTFPNSKIGLFENEEDPYSKNLAGTFQQYFPSSAIIRESYSASDQTKDFQKKIEDLKTKGANLIYFAGDSTHIDNLLNNLPLRPNLPVMGGDALYELGGYAGNNYNLLHFTAFAFPDEWYFPPQSQSIPSSVLRFLHAYPQLLGGSKAPKIYGYTRADSDTLLSYDATAVLVQGCEILSNSGRDCSSQNLIDTLRNFSGSNAFQGFSGRISFGPDGANKAVLLLSVVDGGYTHMVPPPDGCLRATQC